MRLLKFDDEAILAEIRKAAQLDIIINMLDSAGLDREDTIKIIHHLESKRSWTSKLSDYLEKKLHTKQHEDEVPLSPRGRQQARGGLGGAAIRCLSPTLETIIEVVSKK